MNDLSSQAFRQQNELLVQTQYLLSIHSLIEFRQVLPAMGDWAISPDFAATLVALVTEQKPQLVIEAGSGVSTLLIGYCLQKQNLGGRVVALEHDRVYAEGSRAEVVRHGLEGVATVLYAPLRQYVLDGREFLWYDDAALRSLAGPIELLVIDGPPGALQPLSRYPAIPLLHNSLGERATVLLDDADRTDEIETVRRWCTEFPDLDARHLAHAKGTCLLNRRAKLNGSSG